MNILPCIGVSEGPTPDGFPRECTGTVYLPEPSGPVSRTFSGTDAYMRAYWWAREFRDWCLRMPGDDE